MTAAGSGPMGPLRDLSPRTRAGLARRAAGSLAYLLTAWLSVVAFAAEGTTLPLLWLPAGVAFVMLLYDGARAAPFVAVASLAAQALLAAGQGLPAEPSPVLAAAGADIVGPWVAALAYTRGLERGVRTAGDVARFGLLVALLPSLLSAVLLGVNLLAVGVVDPVSAVEAVAVRTLAGALATALSYPLYLARRVGSRLLGGGRGRSTTALLAAVALVAGAPAVAPALVYVAVALVLLVGLREDAHVAGLAWLAVTATAVAAAGAGVSPWAAPMPWPEPLVLVAHLLVLTLVLLGVDRQHERLRQAQASTAQWRQRAEEDALTGLANRRVFETWLRQEVRRQQRHQRAFSVAILDLDHFKRVNDTHGHPTGDRVLVAFAGLLREGLREADVVARIGGEEFGVLLPETTASAAATALERLRVDLARLTSGPDGLGVAVRFSAGVAEYERRETAEALLARADARVYEAKRAGRDRVVAG